MEDRSRSGDRRKSSHGSKSQEKAGSSRTDAEMKKSPSQSQDRDGLSVQKPSTSTRSSSKGHRLSSSLEVADNSGAALSDANERKSRKDTAGTAKKDLSVSVSPSRKSKESSLGPSSTTRRSHGVSTSTRSLSKSHQKAPNKKRDREESSNAKPPRPDRSSSRNPGKSAEKSDVGNRESNVQLLTRVGETNWVETKEQTDRTEGSEQPGTSKEGGGGTGTKRGSTKGINLKI